MLRVSQTKDIRSNKINTPNNTSISTEKNVYLKHKRKKLEHKKDHIVRAIVGDYMVKYMYGWELSDKTKKVVVEHFSGLAPEDLMTYIKSPMKHNPDCFIIDVGTNNLTSNWDPETIKSNIVEVANNSKTDIKY